MARSLTAGRKDAPPPFWEQLPRIFTYPANGDALVKIVAFAVAATLVQFVILGALLAKLVWLSFLGYCFGILERTARGHLVAAQVYHNERTGRDPRPLLQFVIFIIFVGLALVVAATLGALAGQVTLVLVSLVLPASIMVLALDERLGAALNPLRMMEVMAAIGLPYLALCAFLFLLIESAQYLSLALAALLPGWVSGIVADMVTMYFLVSTYYLMGYALYQHHEALGVDVQVESAAAARAVSGKPAAPDVLGPETQGLIGEGRLDDAATRVENRLRRDWDNNKVHDQYQKLLLLAGRTREAERHVNEYIPKLVREKRAGRAVEIYEAAKAKIPALQLTDGSVVLPLAQQASDLHRDATAFELLKGFDRRFPGHADIPGVYLLAGRILLERQNDYAMAQKVLQGVTRKFPAHPLAAEAARLAEIAQRMAASAPAA